MVPSEDLEGLSNLLLICSTTHVEEVSRGTLVELDDVHCGHGQTSAID